MYQQFVSIKINEDDINGKRYNLRYVDYVLIVLKWFFMESIFLVFLDYNSG